MRPIESSQLQIHLRVTEKKQTYYTTYGTSRKVVQGGSGRFFGWEKKEMPTKYWWKKLLKSGQ
jgi:hypothetical protein